LEEAFEVCGKTVSRRLLEEVFREVFGVKEVSSLATLFGDTWAVTLESGDVELSVRCGVEAGGCEILVRVGDAPAVYCGRSCDVDRASPNPASAGEILPRVEEFVRRAGIPLLGSC
jgi:hypothetical protein